MVWWLLTMIFGSGTMTLVVVTAVGLSVMSQQMGPLGQFAMQACAPSGSTGSTGVVQASAKKNSIPKNYFEYYKRIGEEENIPWQVLAAIGKIETDHGRTTLKGMRRGEENYAGAGGPMQFLQTSWAGAAGGSGYGDDGNGDGKEDRYDPQDAILGAANHLRGSIGKANPKDGPPRGPLSENDIRNAVHRYNPGNYTPQSNPYVRDVLAVRDKYLKGDYSLGPPNYVNMPRCAAGSGLAAGSFGQQIAYAAARWTMEDSSAPTPPQRVGGKTPYSWGGGTENGPWDPGKGRGAGFKGFDCSSLAMYAVYQASKKKIKIARTTQAQWSQGIGKKIPRSGPFAPGDLLYFGGPPPTHVAIYYGQENGTHWMVEAKRTGTFVMFSKFTPGSNFLGALRFSGQKSSGTIRAMAPAGAGAGTGAA
ncbi:NlpC/P60 family protein [Actinomadura welshii]|uniref:C40 family peptidase n=1 Tax=Actinomadura welshii TaxID=3103817 RepID=UPI0003AD3529|nr:NlpC/P60 family protein [Actinomadura madurae]